MLGLVFVALFAVGKALKCSELNTGLPCAEVPKCDTGNIGKVVINKLSNGLGPSKSTSDISLCFDDKFLYLNHTALNQNFLVNPNYQNCNDPVYNADVFEMFAAPNMETDPHCYNELDISPWNVMFDAGIYNENLNHTGIQGSDFECSTSGITYTTTINSESHYWTASMSYPFKLLNCPYNCPLKRYCGHDTPNDIYRVNFYRINELTATSKCTSSTCEYMAWSPTGVNPPAFHEPTKFGYILLQF